MPYPLLILDGVTGSRNGSGRVDKRRCSLRGAVHPWRQAAGGWPLGAYARSAPYPRGTVVAQDFFRSGLLPADTDFRVFEASLLRWEKLCPVRCSTASVTGVVV